MSGVVSIFFLHSRLDRDRLSLMESKELTHVGKGGQVQMVDVGPKPETERTAVAAGEVVMRPETLDLIAQGEMAKGDVLNTARLAGVMAAKRTAELIPLCHPIPLTQIKVDLTLDRETSRVKIKAQVNSRGRTGVEMEALTAVSVAALTVYDMAKAVERTMRIENVRLVEKRGGQRGDYFEQQQKLKEG
jgi:cyclic pyranopterin phosphate synthase